MEHVYELYGSTEAPITTLLRPGEPGGSVGRHHSKDIVILNERGEVCPPAMVDAAGRVLNYDEAVGEISKKMAQDDNIFFDGYYKNSDATQQKFKDGYYRSGDLGYVRLVGRKRYLYFSGRTDDWIRKDGENFSAESVLQIASAPPGRRARGRVRRAVGGVGREGHGRAAARGGSDLRSEGELRLVQEAAVGAGWTPSGCPTTCASSLRCP